MSELEDMTCPMHKDCRLVPVDENAKIEYTDVHQCFRVMRCQTHNLTFDQTFRTVGWFPIDVLGHEGPFIPDVHPMVNYHE